MKNKDVIRIVDSTLYMQFLTTGELRTLNIIQLNKDTKFSVLNNELKIHSHTNHSTATIEIEKFSSEQMALSAFESLQEKLSKHYRNQSILNKIKGGLKFVGLPLAVLFFGLAFNGIVAGSLQSKATLSNANALVSNHTSTSLPSSATPSIPQLATPTASVPPTELANGLADGVAAGKFSIQLSNGKKGTLYVFSDPLCPHCKDIESELEKLKDYTVHILPVTIIGQTSSASLVSKILCLPPEKRVYAWKKAISGQDIDTSSCGAGDKAFSANDQIFRQMGFPGTPQIVSGNGQLPDASVDFTAESLSNWLNKVL